MRWTWSFAMASLLGVSVIGLNARLAFAADPVATTMPTAVNAADPEVVKQLARPMPEIKFKHNSLVNVFDFLRDVTNANIYVDWNALKSAGADPKLPVTYTGTGQSFEQMLDGILSNLGATKPIDFKVVGSVIVISTEDGIKNLEKAESVDLAATAGPKLAAALRTSVAELRFNGNGLADVVDFPRDVSGANIYVNWPSLEKHEIKKETPISMRLRDVPFQQALRLIFNQVCTGDEAALITIDRDMVSTSKQGVNRDGVVVITIADPPATAP